MRALEPGEPLPDDDLYRCVEGEVWSLADDPEEHGPMLTLDGFRLEVTAKQAAEIRRAAGATTT